MQRHHGVHDRQRLESDTVNNKGGIHEVRSRRGIREPTPNNGDQIQRAWSQVGLGPMRLIPHDTRADAECQLLLSQNLSYDGHHKTCPTMVEA